MSELELGAIIAFDFEKWDVEEEIALAGRAEIRCIQVYRNVLQGITAGHIREIAEEADLAIDSLHAYIQLEMFPDGPLFDLSAADATVRADAQALAASEAAYARDLGARDVIVHPVGPGDTADDPWRPAALAASAERLAKAAEEAGVRFLLENMPPPMFGSDAAVLRRIVDDVASPHLGLAYDVGHAAMARRETEMIRQMGPRLWGVHLHDNDRTEDTHHLPGMGVIPFEDVARTLAAVEYGGVFMLEIYRDTAEVARDLTPERVAYIHHLRRLASGLPE